MNNNLLRIQAEQLLIEGRVDDAIDAYRHLLELDGGWGEGWYNYGYVLRRARRFGEALEAYGEALRCGVAGAEAVHVNRAVIYSEHLQQPEQAIAELALAVATAPAFTVAWLNLGNLHEDLGDHESARQAYGKALKIEPSNARALARLAAIDVFGGAVEAAIARLTPALAEARTDPARAELAFALGNALDAAGTYDRAWSTFAEANRISRHLAWLEGRRYDRKAAEQLISRLIEAFPSPAPRAQSQSEAPVFIVGMFRSGSTLIEQILARHPRVTAGGELEALPALVSRHFHPYPESLRATNAAALIDQGRALYRHEMKSIFPDHDILTDKRPDNFLHIGLIKSLFPDARIIYTKREMADNLLSIYFLHFEHDITYGFDLGDAWHWYLQHQRLMDHWRALYPESIHQVDYEAVVAEPRQEVGRMTAFLGLDWDEALLSHRAAGAVRTASVWQVRQPLHQRSAGRWKNYEKYLAALPFQIMR